MAADYDLTDEEQVKLFLKNIETEYKYQCFSEKEIDGCHRLADFMNSVIKDEKIGSALFKKNCDENNYAHSCFKYAGNSIYGKGVERNVETGVKYFEKACEYGFPRGCANAGIMLIKGHDVAKDYKKGIELLTKACDQNRGEACSTLGYGYLCGQYDLEKNGEKASTLFDKACRLGSFSGCVNLSKMYKNGDLVARNDALAEKYKLEAIKVRKSADGSEASYIQFGKTG